MKDYINDIVVWAIIGGIAATLYFALFKKRRNFIFLLGMLLIIGALPAGFILELSANGCCGAPSTPYKGIGFVLTAAMSNINTSAYGLPQRFTRSDLQQRGIFDSEVLIRDRSASLGS